MKLEYEDNTEDSLYIRIQAIRNRLPDTEYFYLPLEYIEL